MSPPGIAGARLIPACLWKTRPALIVALDARFGPPVDAYVNGSQVWLREDGPAGMTIEWRLHPVGAYRRPEGLDTYDLFDAVAAALAKGPSGPSEREMQGPSGPSEREMQGPSGPSEREMQGPSGPSERERQGTEMQAPAAPDTLWGGLEAFAAYDDEVEPAMLAAACTESLGLPPDASGLVDHHSVGDTWERSGRSTSIFAALLDQLSRPTGNDPTS